MRQYKHLLVLLFILLITVSCGAETVTETQADTQSSAETVVETFDPAVVNDLPDDLSFDGTDFQMLSPDEYGGISFAEELTGEILNDAQYQMEIDTEERLDVVITEVPSKFWEMQASVINLCMSGDSTYSSIVMMDRFALACAYEDCFFSMDDVEHINLDKMYWGGDISQSLRVGDKLFFGIGSFNLKSYVNTSCVYYNGTLGKNLGADSPVEAVHDGTWTLDAFKSYENIATVDLNGDGTMDSADRYTYGSNGTRSLGAQFWIACDMSLITKDTEGIPCFTANADEKFYDVMEYTYQLLFQSGNRLDLEKAGGDKYNSIANFTAGKELLNVGTFSSVTAELREMEDDYTILPMPKYDEAQIQYYCRTFDPMYAMVPITAAEPAMSGAVLEYLSYTAYHNVIPAYLETSLQEKYSRDQDSVEFIQIAFDSRRIDIAEVLIFDIFGDQAIYDNIMRKADFRWVTYLESKQKVIETALEKYIKLADNAG